MTDTTAYGFNTALICTIGDPLWIRAAGKVGCIRRGGFVVRAARGEVEVW